MSGIMLVFVVVTDGCVVVMVGLRWTVTSIVLSLVML